MAVAATPPWKAVQKKVTGNIVLKKCGSIVIDQVDADHPPEEGVGEGEHHPIQLSCLREWSASSLPACRSCG
jgi:hypothetical protein